MALIISVSLVSAACSTHVATPPKPPPDPASQSRTDALPKPEPAPKLIAPPPAYGNKIVMASAPSERASL